MPPPLALLLTLFFSVVLLVYLRRRQRAAPALWLPILWIFFVGSKFPSQWLEALGLWRGGAASMEEGSPLDAAFFLALIALGTFVLARRNVQLTRLVRSNLWLTVFLAYCFLAIFWSDFPVVALKRWIKVLGHPVMALVVLTERDPLGALRAVFQRTAVLMLPWSILLIKYYPHLGRYFDAWTGLGLNGGIHHNKNELGYTCMVLGIFFIWNLSALRRLPGENQARSEFWLTLLWLSLVGWLLAMADSATPLVCLVLATGTSWFVGSRFVSRRFIGVQLILMILLVIAAELTFGIHAETVRFLGRNPSLTDRTEVWADLLAVDINPLVGAGFESFWLGHRREAIWSKWWWQPNQAHNGYIETYLNLGWIGVGLLIAVLWGTYRKARLELVRNLDYGRLRFAFLFAILAYNYTEATFKGVHLVWTAFYLIALDYAVRSSEAPAGAQVRAGNALWRREPVATGMSGWNGTPRTTAKTASTAMRTQSTDLLHL